MFKIAKKIYTWIALTSFNLIAVFIILNLLLGLIYFTKDSIQNCSYFSSNRHLFNENGTPIKTKKRTEVASLWFDFNTCKEIGEKHAAEVLDDFYDFDLKGLIYQPWVQFSEQPFKSKRLNIILDERGFPIRKTINSSKLNSEKLIRIFTFGGSTTFGYFVSDEHTWPSFLSQALNEQAKKEKRPFKIEVVNYGRDSYYPTQEGIFLIDLLKHGHRPSLVIFLDGVNWELPEDVPGLTEEVAKIFLARQSYECFKLEGLLLKYKWLPIVRFIEYIQDKIQSRYRNKVQVNYQQATTKHSLNRFEQNRKLVNLICSTYGIKSLFFLQPNSFYKYNLALYRPELQKKEFENNKDIQKVKMFYEEMKRKSGYIDLSSLFELWGTDKKAVIDICHYSPAFGKFLAEHIETYINLGELKIFPQIVDDSQATGSPRTIIIKEDLQYN